jgi:hypothetical protein
MPGRICVAGIDIERPLILAEFQLFESLSGGTATRRLNRPNRFIVSQGACADALMPAKQVLEESPNRMK